jgi:5-methylcytosine-specific restriction enzyme subunit McrC
MLGEADSNDASIIELASRSAVELRLSQVFDSDDLWVYPHVEAKGLLFLNFRRGKVVVSAGAFIGRIPLTKKLSFEVVPKLPTRNLVRIFESSNQSLGMLPVQRTYAVEGEAGDGILAFLTENLIVAVRRIATYGFAKTYQREEVCSSHPRGRVRLRETAAQLARGRPFLVAVDHFQQTADTVENRFLKTALVEALKGIRRDFKARHVLLAAAAQTLRQMPDEVHILTSSQIARVSHSSLSEQSHNERYRPALDIAHMILARRGLSLERSEAFPLHSYVLNLEEVFEDYLRNGLRSRLAPRLSILNGNDEGKRPLYQGTSKAPHAQPDIVVHCRQSGNTLPVEVKYKTDVGRPDVNQAVTYALVYGASSVVLLHVSKITGKSGSYLIGRVGGVDLWGYAFDMNAESLETEEDTLAAFVWDMLSKAPTAQ